MLFCSVQDALGISKCIVLQFSLTHAHPHVVGMPLVNKLPEQHYNINLCHIHCTITNNNRMTTTLYSTETQTSLSQVHEARLIYVLIDVVPITS